MRKLFICVSVVGLAVLAVYWLCKKGKSNDIVLKTENEKVDSESKPQEDNVSRNANVVEDMYQVKSESARSVQERHSEACEIMKDAYSNIMEDFVEDFSDEKNTNEKEKNEDVIIDNEAVSVMKEIDSISDELDDMLK